MRERLREAERGQDAPGGRDWIGFAGQHEIGGFPTGLHETLVHGADLLEILPDHAFDGSAALDDIALETPDKTDIRGGIDKDRDVEHGAQGGRGKRVYPLHHDQRPRG